MGERKASGGVKGVCTRVLRQMGTHSAKAAAGVALEDPQVHENRIRGGWGKQEGGNLGILRHRCHRTASIFPGTCFLSAFPFVSVAFSFRVVLVNARTLAAPPGRNSRGQVRQTQCFAIFFAFSLFF